MLTLLEAVLLSICISIILSRGLGYASLMVRFTPMMMGLLTGIILKDLTNALKISALVQLLYLGVLAPGGIMRSEPAVAISFTIPIILLSGVSISLAIPIAFIFGVFGGYIYPYRIKINSCIIRLTERNVELGDEKALFKSIILYPILFSTLFYSAVFFVSYLILVPLFVMILKYISQTSLYPIFITISSTLPFVGFALSMHVMGKSSQIFFFVGSFIIALLLKPYHMNLFLYAFVGLVLSIIVVLYRERMSN